MPVESRRVALLSEVYGASTASLLFSWRHFEQRHPESEKNGVVMILKIVAFVLPLGLDTLAISIALGLRGFAPWRPALTFALFEGLMPIVGIVLGRFVGGRFETAAVLLGGIILIGLGIQSIREVSEVEEEIKRASFASLRSALLVGLAISTDELAIGFPIGASRLPIPTLLTAIAVQAFFVAVLGIATGNRLGSDLGLRASRYASIAAGGVFILLGLWLISERIALH